MKKLGIIIFMILSFQTSVFAEPVEVIPPQNKILGSTNGRYVFGQISGSSD